MGYDKGFEIKVGESVRNSMTRQRQGRLASLIPHVRERAEVMRTTHSGQKKLEWAFNSKY